jgi:outer membrane protein assembly factor BamB
VRAYDAESGSFVWEDRIVGYSGAHALAFENGRLFAGGWKYRPNREYAIVRAYNGRSGDLLWERSTPGAVGFRQTFTSTIKAQGGRVFAAQPRRTIQPPFALIPLIVTYDGQSGTPLWQDQFTPEGYLRDLDVFGNRLFAVGEGGPHCSTSSDSNCDEVIRGYDATSGQLLWTRRLDLSGTEDYAALITATSGKVFVLAQANSTAVIPDCCAVGQWVLQAFNDAGQLLWQTVEGELESGVYNMALDRGRLFIPGRAVSAETGQWDFLVRAYDVRGRRSDIEPVFFVPGNLRLAGAAGKVSYQVTSDSPFIADAHGLIPAEETSGTVIDDPANDIGAALATGVGITVHPVSVPAGTRLFRAALSSWATDGADDLNLYAFDSRGRLVASSQNVSTDELLDISLPGPGKYYVVVHGFQTDGPDANYTLFTWLLGERAEGNLTVTQPVPDTGAEWTVSLSWSGLIDDRRYLGAVTYTVGGIEKRQTLIAVDP